MIRASAFVSAKKVVFENEIPEAKGGDIASAGVSIIEGRQFIELACDSGDNPVPTTTAVGQASVQNRIGGYQKELPHTADLDMWLRFAASGHVGILQTVQAFKREHSASMLKQFTPRILPDLRQRLFAFETALGDIREQLGNAEELLDKAKRVLSGHSFWGAHALFERGHEDVARHLLDFALELNPKLQDSREWRRFVWKRRLGLGAWHAIAAVAKRFRGNSSRAP